MDYTNITKRNIVRIQKRVAAEVNKLGIIIAIKRVIYKPDSLNGFQVDGEKEVLKKKMVFISYPSAYELVVEGGRKVTVSAKLVIPYDKSVELKKGDYFELNNIKYYVVDCVNVDNLNVYFNASLTGDLKELNGYG